MVTKPGAKKVGKEKSGLAATKKFVLQKKLKAALPAHERPKADEVLWEKSGGVCALCGRALLPADAEPDHRIPSSNDGTDELGNLYLAHRTCNRSRGNLPFGVARPIVEFKAFCDESEGVTFDDVIDRYLPPGKSRYPIAYEVVGSNIVVGLGGQKVTAPLYTDPATQVQYFFMEVPPQFIHNDAGVQPRKIMHTHVRALGLDFVQRPVHEPSNCRLVATADGSGMLLQFDGQHKTTAQLLLQRDAIPTKVYIDPDVAMIQSLVLKIQQEIKKQPLTRSDTLAKLGDVMKRRLEIYFEETPGPRTEKGFVAFQAGVDRKAVAKEYSDELVRLVFFDDTNQLTAQVKPGAKEPPTTDKVVVERIIRPLLHTGLLDSDMEKANDRDHEREMVVLVLNTIVQKMLPTGWNHPGNELQRRRAQNFFYQASIGWWMEQLLLALRYVTQRIQEKQPLFVGDLTQEQRDQVVIVTEKLCDLAIWSTDQDETLKAMRSNTVKNLAPLLAKNEWKDLLP
ncbi:MAG: HNH endonuclease signature motif containing protein [Gemmatimonadales bacterium]|nr:HNH endonuclease signature motif containing protein [Gemmatimonadales bacterium]